MVRGSCLCGSVKFEVAKCSTDIFKCHCSRCRKSFGGASSAVTFVQASDFEWLSGEGEVARFALDAGYARHFCKTCGAVVPLHIPSHSLYWVPAGLFDSDPEVILGRHVHVASRAPWEVLDGQTEALEEGFDF